MAEKTLEFQTTLVRYNNPTLVIKHDDKKGEKDVSCWKVIDDHRTWKFKLFYFRKFQRVQRTAVQHQEASGTLGRKLKRS